VFHQCRFTHLPRAVNHPNLVACENLLQALLRPSFEIHDVQNNLLMCKWHYRRSFRSCQSKPKLVFKVSSCTLWGRDAAAGEGLKNPFWF
jgi:hypothetical protein